MLQDVTQEQFTNFARLCKCAEWCRKHNGKLIRLDNNGIYYIVKTETETEIEKYISYNEM